MKPRDGRHPWNRLTAAARRAEDERDVAAPFGFAARVVARSLLSERRVASLVERFALRALGIAAAIAAVSAVVNYQAIRSPDASAPVAYVQEQLPADEAIALVLDLSAD